MSLVSASPVSVLRHETAFKRNHQRQPRLSSSAVSVPLGPHCALSLSSSRVLSPSPSLPPRAQPQLVHIQIQIQNQSRYVQCRASGDEDSSGSTESLFVRELKRRGISNPKVPSTDSTGENPTGGTSSSSSTSSTSSTRSASTASTAASSSSSSSSTGRSQSSGNWVEGQRERSQALNSEGLEGLPYRAWQLIQLGGSFYWTLWPLALFIVGTFVAVYLFLGTEFVHQGKPGAVSVPAYIDPYDLLEKEDELLPRVPYTRAPPPPPLSAPPLVDDFSDVPDIV